MRRTTRAVVAATSALALGALTAGPVAAGGAPLTFTVAPNPATPGQLVTLEPVQPCPDPGNVQQVEALVDIPDTPLDLILNTSADPVTGDWSFTFEAGGPVGSYPISVSCVYVAGNQVYEPEVLVVEAAPATTSSTTTTTTAAPTSTTAAPAPAVVAAPAFTG